MAEAVPVPVGLKVTVKGADWPAGMVSGNEIPLTTNAVLFVLAPVIVTLAPVAFKSPDAVPLVPTTTLPIPIVVGETASCPAAVVVPLPVTVAVVVVGCASLVNVSVAVAEPVTEGLNVTVNDADWPAAIVTGTESPLTTKAALFDVAPVTVTLAPVALKLPVAVPLLPTTTLPTARVLGDTPSCPTVVVPVPDNEMFMVGVEAFDVTVRVPLAEPAVVGLKLMLTVTLVPGANVNGTANVFIVKALPLIAT